MTTIPEKLGFRDGWEKRAADRMSEAAEQMADVWLNLTEEVDRLMDDPTKTGGDLIGFIFGAAFGMGFAMGELQDSRPRDVRPGAFDDWKGSRS